MQLRATKLTAIASAVKRAFNISSLFSGGAPGVWYDPSDYSTLFQDSAGTTPVTAVEQPVGLMLDKSQGLVLGSELVTNGDFSNGSTGWTYIAGTTNSASVVSGQLVFTAAGAGPTYATYRQSVLTVGKWYQIEFDLIALGASPGNNIYIEAGGSGIEVGSTLGRRRIIRTAVGTNLNIIGIGGGTIDNISVKELPGNHAFQSTSASRPVLSARYNLLTKTEQFNDDAVWLKINTTATSGLISETATTGEHYTLQGATGDLFTVELKEKGRDNVRLFVGTSTAGDSISYKFSTNAFSGVGTNITEYTSELLSDGYIRLRVKRNAVASQVRVVLLDGAANSYAGDITKGVFARKADLRFANQGVNLPAYQRVNTSTDYDTTGFLPYLKFDGVDDSLSTNSISFTSTDKMSVFAGVRKLSDTYAAIVGLSVDTAANAGSFELASFSGSFSYLWDSKGTVAARANTSGYAAPITNSLTALGDISGDRATLRVNGAQVAQSTADQGTGNFSNNPLYIGRRAGASLPFNGQLYSMVIVGKAVTAGELSSTETYVATKTGVLI
jgi:hypothetical protein